MFIRVIIVSVISCFILSCASSSKGAYSYSPAEVNLIKSKNWLAINLKREGVVETDSGLQYKVLKHSDGCKPDDAYKVKVHYKMVSVKSKKTIDSSYQRGKPDKFQLSKMVKGWREGVPMMRVGETWELYIPPHLAYGKRGLGSSVAPNSVLVSEIRLMGVGRCFNE